MIVPLSDLVSLTKPRDRVSSDHAETTRNRRTLDLSRTTLAEAASQTQGWPPSRERSRRSYGHSVRAQDRNSLGDASPGDGLRLWDDLLATPPQGVAQGRGVGQ